MTFNVWGVNFEISYLFACSVLLCIACDKTNSFIPMLLSIACHEAAHVIVLNIFSCEIKKVKLAAGTIGIEFNKQVDGLKHMIALLAGPAANILLALIGCIINNDIWFMINLVLAIYNLLPIRGLDGCDILELIICRFTGEKLFSKIILVFSLFFMFILALFFIVMIPEYGINYSVFLSFAYVVIQFVIKK